MAREKAWVDAIPVAALETGWVTPVTVAGRRLAVYDTPEGVFVTAALCTHNGADLCDGYFDGRRIECPLHQGCFDVRTGKAVGKPATRDLRTFEARVEDGMVRVLV